jgi:uncharacterized protein involved in exopolysaccharide biosynthesis
MLKDTYVSDALIRIVPQQISPEVVPDITAQDISERINAMAQSIESHNTLATIITSYGLYPKDLKSAPMDDVVAKMKKAIKIRPVEGVTTVAGKDLPAMQVLFEYGDALTAQKVCADIVSRFVDANSEQQVASQQEANSFLTEQYNQAKRELEAMDLKLQEFRTKNAGRLPDEVNGNVAEMNALQQRSASLSDALDRNSEQRMMIVNQLEIANDRLKSIRANSPQTQAQSQRVNELDHEIEQLQSTIASMKNRYYDDYPDLQTAKDRLKVLQQERDEAFKEKPKTDSGPSPESLMLSRDRQDAENVVRQYQAELNANKMEGTRIQKQLSQVNAAVGGAQTRLESLPAGEKEYTELTRDRELIKERYDRAEQQRQRSVASLELNRRKQGETLEVLDTASLPGAPSKPKRAMIIPIGAAVGLGLGLALIVMREMKDSSLKSLKDARLYTQLSVLGSIPLLENDVVVQRRKQVIWVSWAAATALGLLIMAGSVVHYYMGKA